MAPNSTLIGEVVVGNDTSIWNNCVIRGDLNSVLIGNLTSIGDNTIIHTAGSLPNGLPASVSIGEIFFYKFPRIYFIYKYLQLKSKEMELLFKVDPRFTLLLLKMNAWWDSGPLF